MKLQHVDVQGAGKAIRVHLFIGEEESAEASRQWLEGKVEVNIVGTMDVEALQRAALTQLRNVLDAQLAAMNGARQPASAA